MQLLQQQNLSFQRIEIANFKSTEIHLELTQSNADIIQQHRDS